MLTSFLFLILAVAAFPCFDLPWRASRKPSLDVSVAEAISDLNALRLARGLNPVETDTALCFAIRREVRRSSDESEAPFLTDAAWTRGLDRAVPDWEKDCFHTAVESLSGVGAKLQEMPGFVEAALSPDASHIALAIGDRPGGGFWCATCIVQRLVHLGPFWQWFNEGAGGCWWICGVSRYRHLRVTLSRYQEGSTDREREEYSEELEADDAGRFEVALPFSRFDPGDYVMFVYIREGPDGYRAATKTYIQMPGPQLILGAARGTHPDSKDARSN